MQLFPSEFRISSGGKILLLLRAMTNILMPPVNWFSLF
jgi:hypothetical protein